jgi:hypothetical protein
MTERPTVLFAQPDSPTIPTHSPASIEKDTPSTALTVAARQRNCVWRSATAELRVEIVDLEDGVYPGTLLRPSRSALIERPVRRARPLSSGDP